MNHITFFSRYLNESLNNILTYSPYVLRTRSNRKKMKRRKTFIFESITEHREFIYLYFIYIQNTNQSGENKSSAKKVLRKFLQPCSHKHSHSLWVLINCFILVFLSTCFIIFITFENIHMHVFICFGYYLYNFTKSREKTGGSASLYGWNIRNVE